ncbi:hypothetical protein BC826DRAFT_1188318, partial [Russula brevipes]
STRCQCNANGGEHALPVQREWRRARAASATRTAASAALPAQHERRRAPCCQHNANGSEYCAGRATGA